MIIRNLLLLSGAPAFAPSDLSGTVAWYDSAELGTLWQDNGRTSPVTADAQVVGAWDSRVGSFPLLQATAGNRPTYKVNIQNGKPILRFDGGDRVIDSSFADFGDSYHVFIVGMYSSSGSADDSQAMLEVSTGTFNTGFKMYHTTVIATLSRDAGANRANSDVDARDSTYILQELSADGSSCSLHKNGVQVDSTTYTSPNPNTLSEIRVGEGNLSTRLIGDIAEIVLIDGAITAGERTQMNNYLNDKWSLY